MRKTPKAMHVKSVIESEKFFRQMSVLYTSLSGHCCNLVHRSSSEHCCTCVYTDHCQDTVVILFTDHHQDIVAHVSTQIIVRTLPPLDFLSELLPPTLFSSHTVCSSSNFPTIIFWHWGSTKMKCTIHDFVWTKICLTLSP